MTFLTNRNLQFGCVLCTNMSFVSFRFVAVLPKAKAIQSSVRKQNCSSFDNKSTSSRILTELTSFVDLHGQCKI